MPKQIINIGSNANDGTGDPLRTAFNKINDNFSELYGDDSSADTFTSPQITTPTITGTATIDNLVFNDSQISTATNANLELNPGGTGTIELQAATNINGALDVTGAVTVDTSLTLSTGATITAILDEDNMSSNSDTAVPTQQSVKAYIDAQNQSQAITFVGDDSTGTAVNSGETFQIAGGTGLTSVVTGDTLTIAIDSSIVTLTGTQSLENKTLTTPTINGAIMTGNVTVDSLIFNDSEISTDTNADLNLNPGGTGTIELQANTNITGNANISGSLDVTGTTTVGTLNTGTINTSGSYIVTGNITAQGTVYSDRIKSPATNANLSISSQGTGVVDIQSAMTTVGQTINGNITMPDGFTAELGNIQIYSNTITSTTSGNINIVASGTGSIILNSERASTNHLLANEITVAGNVNTDSIRSNISNADIAIETQGTGQVLLNSVVKFNAGYVDAINSLTSSSTITVDCNLAPVHKVTLATNTAFVVTNLPTGGTVTLVIRQDATGLRTATFGTDTSTAVKFPSGAATLSTAANSIDVVTIFNDGTDYLGNIANSYS